MKQDLTNYMFVNRNSELNYNVSLFSNRVQKTPPEEVKCQCFWFLHFKIKFYNKKGLSSIKELKY